MNFKTNIKYHETWLHFNQVWWLVMPALPGVLFWIQGRKFQKPGHNWCNQGQIFKAGAQLMQPGAQYWFFFIEVSLRRNTQHWGPLGSKEQDFLTMLACSQNWPFRISGAEFQSWRHTGGRISLFLHTGPWVIYLFQIRTGVFFQ